MTIEEKKEALKKYCNDKNDCKDCVFASEETVCYLDTETCYSNISDKRINELYNILVYNIKGGIDLSIQEKREIVKISVKLRKIVLSVVYVILIKIVGILLTMAQINKLKKFTIF